MIKQLLASQSQTAAQNAVDKRGQEGTGSPRRPAAAAYAMADCQGYKAPKTSSTTTPGTAPDVDRTATAPPARPTAQRRRHDRDRDGSGDDDAVDDHHPVARRAPEPRRSRRRCCASTRSPGGSGASVRGTASRTSARSSRTRSRRPTSWPTRPTAATTPSCSTSSVTSSSRSTSSPCCSRSAAPATWPRSAEHCTEKLIRRHPHVFGEVEAQNAGEVLRNWDQIKRGEPGREPGIFGEVPENLPGAALRPQGPAARRLERL